MSRDPCSQSPRASRPADRPSRGARRKGGTLIPSEGEAHKLGPEGPRATKIGDTTPKRPSRATRTAGIWHRVRHVQESCLGRRLVGEGQREERVVVVVRSCG
jgi:hypothetical protein